jgi:hypothetical protein
MRLSHRSYAVAFVAGLVLLLGACNGALDHGDSPNVVLSISQFPTIPPVTTTYDATIPGCVFTLPTGLTVTLKNQSKNSLAASPFSDVVIDSALVSYVWDDGRTEGKFVESDAGTIPTGGTGSVALTPILLRTLTADRAGHNANLYVTFHGKTIDNREIESLPGPPGGGVISIDSCVPTGG